MAAFFLTSMIYPSHGPRPVCSGPGRPNRAGRMTLQISGFSRYLRSRVRAKADVIFCSPLRPALWERRGAPCPPCFWRAYRRLTPPPRDHEEGQMGRHPRHALRRRLRPRLPPHPLALCRHRGRSHLHPLGLVPSGSVEGGARSVILRFPRFAWAEPSSPASQRSGTTRYCLRRMNPHTRHAPRTSERPGRTLPKSA